MLACALQDEQVNHLVIILYSEQGKGKVPGYAGSYLPSGGSITGTEW